MAAGVGPNHPIPGRRPAQPEAGRHRDSRRSSRRASRGASRAVGDYHLPAPGRNRERLRGAAGRFPSGSCGSSMPVETSINLNGSFFWIPQLNALPIRPTLRLSRLPVRSARSRFNLRRQFASTRRSRASTACNRMSYLDGCPGRSLTGPTTHAPSPRTPGRRHGLSDPAACQVVAH